MSIGKTKNPAAAIDKRLAGLSAGKLRKKGKTALCLGGGGARGYAHIGAIKAFEENALGFDIIVGTSVGALVGALYAYGLPAERIMHVAAELDMKDIHNGNILFANDADKIARIIRSEIGDVTIEEINEKSGKTFACVAVDLTSARQIVLSSGNASACCSASCAVPVLFKPVEMEGMHLVDGGVLNNIPADVCRMLGADNVISVDINPTRGHGTDKTGPIAVFKTVFSLMSAASSYSGIINSDVLIEVDTDEFTSTKKDGFMEMYERGYAAAREKMYDISLAMFK